PGCDPGRQELEFIGTPCQSRCAQAARRADGDIPGQRQAEFIPLVLLYRFGLQTSSFEPQFQLIGQLLRQVARSENSNRANVVTQFGRQLTQGDANLARNRVGLQDATAAFQFERSLECAQGEDSTANRQLQSHVCLTDGQSEDSIRVSL